MKKTCIKRRGPVGRILHWLQNLGVFIILTVKVSVSHFVSGIIILIKDFSLLRDYIYLWLDLLEFQNLLLQEQLSLSGALPFVLILCYRSWTEEWSFSIHFFSSSTWGLEFKFKEFVETKIKVAIKALICWKLDVNNKRKTVLKFNNFLRVFMS